MKLLSEQIDQRLSMRNTQKQLLQSFMQLLSFCHHFFSSLDLVWFYLTHIQMSPLPLLFTIEQVQAHPLTVICWYTKLIIQLFFPCGSTSQLPVMRTPCCLNHTRALAVESCRDSQLILCSVLGNNGPPASIFYISVSDILFSMMFLLSFSLSTLSSTTKLFTVVRSYQRIPCTQKNYKKKLQKKGARSHTH